MLVAELKASAERAGGGVSWTSLAFQERVAAELMGNPVAEQCPPRKGYVSRVTKVCPPPAKNKTKTRETKTK